MENMKIPDVNFSGGQMKNMKLTVDLPTNIDDDIDFFLNPDQNSIIFKAKNLFARLNGDFKYHVFLLDVTGQAYVNMSDVEFDFELGLITQPGSHHDKFAPAYKLLNININVDPDKISIKLEGGLVAKIASLFTDIFKKEIIKSVIENVKQEAV